MQVLGHFFINIRSFVHTAHSFACSAPFVLLTRLLTHTQACGKVMVLFAVFNSVPNHSDLLELQTSKSSRCICIDADESSNWDDSF